VATNRSIGRANEVAALIAKDPRLFPELVSSFWSNDHIVRMRAAAAEKVTREQPQLPRLHKRELLGLPTEKPSERNFAGLAAMIPRLELNLADCQKAANAFQTFLEDRSSIVKTSALQALADLALRDREMRAGVIEKLREARRNGTPAMKARSRKLLARLERSLTEGRP
jgi:hypothetical protein